MRQHLVAEINLEDRRVLNELPNFIPCCDYPRQELENAHVNEWGKIQLYKLDLHIRLLNNQEKQERIRSNLLTSMRLLSGIGDDLILGIKENETIFQCMKDIYKLLEFTTRTYLDEKDHGD